MFNFRLVYVCGFFFLMIRRPPSSTQSRSSAASDVYKRQEVTVRLQDRLPVLETPAVPLREDSDAGPEAGVELSLIHISEPTRPS